MTWRDLFEAVLRHGPTAGSSAAPPAANRDLFDAVRAGLGQCGIVIGATLRLVRAPQRVRRFQLFYRDQHSSPTSRAAAGDTSSTARCSMTATLHPTAGALDGSADDRSARRRDRGPAWRAFREARRRYDPAGILTPGYLPPPQA